MFEKLKNKIISKKTEAIVEDLEKETPKSEYRGRQFTEEDMVQSQLTRKLKATQRQEEINYERQMLQAEHELKMERIKAEIQELRDANGGTDDIDEMFYGTIKKVLEAQAIQKMGQQAPQQQNIQFQVEPTIPEPQMAQIQSRFTNEQIKNIVKPYISPPVKQFVKNMSDDEVNQFIDVILEVCEE